jgi:hypothetical protein
MNDGFDLNSGRNTRFEFSFGWTRIFTEMRRTTFRHEFVAPASLAGNRRSGDEIYHACKLEARIARAATRPSGSKGLPTIADA